MASFTLKTSRFPSGTVLGAYLAAGNSAFPAGGPPGAAVATATLEGTEATFTGLQENVSYFAAAQVGGVWQSVRFRPGRRTTASVIVTVDAAGGVFETRSGEHVEVPSAADLADKADLVDGKLDESQLPGSVMGVVAYDSVKEAWPSRPASPFVTWIGSAEPGGMHEFDIWRQV